MEGHNLNGERDSSVFFNNSTQRAIRYRFDPMEVCVMASLPMALWAFVTIVRVCSNTHALCLFNNGVLFFSLVFIINFVRLNRQIGGMRSNHGATV